MAFRRSLAVNLDIEFALLQRVDLFGSQIKSAGDRTGRPSPRLGDREIENRVSADTGHRSQVEMRIGCRRSHFFKRSGYGKLFARERRGSSAHAGYRGR